ncbi:MAG: nuclease A inhibitor family protein, partial [Gemmatimonadota bacterium]|nr:nuclease A inhibitor family protein [Gemmatimonadota bacterium]
PNDPIAQAEMERFRSLKQTLQESLEEVHVVRVGEVEVRCYVVGRGASGDLAGLVTTAWES